MPHPKPIWCAIVCLLFAVAAAAPTQAQPYTDTPFADVPSPYELAFLDWCVGLRDYRAYQCIDVPRTPYYFELGEAEGGTGSFLDPFTEPTLDRLVQKIGTLPAPWHVYLRRGEVWRGGRSLIIDQAGCAVGAWGAGHRPILTSFQPLSEGSVATTNGWTGDSASAVRKIALNRSIGTLVFDSVWVARSSPATRKDPGVAQYYREVALANQVHDPGTFHYNPQSGTLTVAKLPEDEWEELEATTSNQNGILLAAGADRAWIDGIATVGWGIGNDGYGIRMSGTGNSVQLLTDCFADCTSKHSLGAAGGGGNRVAVMIGCEAGANQATPGGATNYVGYADHGGEFIMWDCLTFANKLEGPSSEGISYTYISHASANNQNRLCLVWGMHTVAGSSDRTGGIDDVPGSNPIDGSIEDVRGWSVNEIFEADPDQSFNAVIDITRSTQVYINSYLLGLRAAGFENPWLFRTGNESGWFLNCVLEFDFRDVTNSIGASMNFTSESDALSRVVFENCLVNVWGPDNPGQVFSGWTRATMNEARYDGDGVRIHNSIFCQMLDTPGGSYIHVVNQQPGERIAWGGQSHCAFYNFRPDNSGAYYGYSSGLNPIQLTQPVLVTDADAPEALREAGAWNGLEYDLYGAPRLDPPTVGPFELVPLPDCGPGDINTTGTQNGVPDGEVNISDLQLYLGWWQQDREFADINTTGTENGTPDGEVNISDLQYYFSVWQDGLGFCP